MIVSNTLYKLNKNCIIRMNLAWFKTTKDIKKELRKYKTVFVDIPDNRRKPPKRVVSKETLVLIKTQKQIKFIGVSNCNIDKLIENHNIFNKQIVPKIEEANGIKDIQKICKFLLKNYKKDRLVMIDHEDMYENLKTAEEVVKSIKKIYTTCKKYKCIPIIVSGVVFDELKENKIELMI